MSFFYDESTQRQADELSDNFGIDESLVEAGAWTGFGNGLGMGIMRETFAQTGRTAAMAAAVPSIVWDKMAGTTERQDLYFKDVIDDTFNDAIDYWTPSEKEVGMAGQLGGGLVGGLGQLALGLGNPSLMIANAQMGTSTDLVRHGIDADKALDVGTASGIATAVGAWLPVFGKTGVQKVVGNAAINPLIGIAQRAVQSQMLEGTDQAANFNPWDMNAIVLDAAMGAAFGYVSKRMGETAPDVVDAIIGKGATKSIQDNIGYMFGDYKPNPSEIDDLMGLANIKSRTYDSAPGRPIDEHSANMHTAAMEESIRALSEGREPNLSMLDDSVRFESRTAEGVDLVTAGKDAGLELIDEARVAKASAPMRSVDVAPVEAAPVEGQVKSVIDNDYHILEAKRTIDEVGDVQVVDAESGNMVSGRKVLEDSVAEVRNAETLSTAFKAVAGCILGD